MSFIYAFKLTMGFPKRLNLEHVGVFCFLFSLAQPVCILRPSQIRLAHIMYADHTDRFHRLVISDTWKPHTVAGRSFQPSSPDVSTLTRLLKHRMGVATYCIFSWQGGSERTLVCAWNFARIVVFGLHPCPLLMGIT